MMRVIIDEQKTIAGVLYFKPAPGVFEFEKGTRNFLKGDPKFVGQRDDTNSIVDVVPSGNIQHRFAQLFVPKINTKNRCKIAQVDIGATIVGVFGKTVGDCGFSLRAQSRRVYIIGVEKDYTDGWLDELSENFFDRGKIDIEIKVLLFNVQNEDIFGAKATQRSIPFVAFRHKTFATWIPMRIASKNRNFCTDVIRWMEPGFAQNVRCHRGGGRFSMHSCNNDPALALHDGGEGFGPTHGRFSRIMCAHENWIVDLDCRRKDNKIGGASVVRTMGLVKTQTEPLQSIRLHGAGFVAATNLVPKLEQESGETAHPAASDKIGRAHV